MTTTTLRFAKAAPRVYTAHTRVALPCRSGFGSYEIDLHFRLDGREGRFYRVDMGCLTGWEAIDGGADVCPRNVRDAKALACAYLARVRDQGTLHPR